MGLTRVVPLNKNTSIYGTATEFWQNPFPSGSGSTLQLLHDLIWDSGTETVLEKWNGSSWVTLERDVVWELNTEVPLYTSQVETGAVWRYIKWLSSATATADLFRISVKYFGDYVEKNDLEKAFIVEASIADSEHLVPDDPVALNSSGKIIKATGAEKNILGAVAIASYQTNGATSGLVVGKNYSAGSGGYPATYPSDWAPKVRIVIIGEVGGISGATPGNTIFQKSDGTYGEDLANTVVGAIPIGIATEATKFWLAGNVFGEAIQKLRDSAFTMTTLGDTLYGGASGVVTRLAGNTTTTKKFLSQTGDGVNSAAPGWNALVTGDIPTTLTSNRLFTDIVSFAPDTSYGTALLSAAVRIFVATGVFSTNDSNPVVAIQGYSKVPRLNLGRINGTPAAKTSILNGDVLGEVAFTGWTGSKMYEGARIVAAAIDNWDDPDDVGDVFTPTKIDFYVGWIGDNAGTTSPSMTLQGDNVGAAASLHLTYTDLHMEGNAAYLDGTITMSGTATATGGFSNYGTPLTSTYASGYSDWTSLGNVGFFAGQDSNNTVVSLVSHAATSKIVFARAQGTHSSKTVLTNGNVIGAIDFVGWDGSAIITAGTIKGYAEEDWSHLSQTTTAIDFLVSKHSDPGALVTAINISGFNNTVYVPTMNFQVSAGHAYFSHDLDVADTLLVTGTSGHTLKIGSSVSAPSTSAGSSFSNYYGTSSTNVLGTPVVWALINVAGTDRKIPCY